MHLRYHLLNCRYADRVKEKKVGGQVKQIASLIKNDVSGHKGRRDIDKTKDETIPHKMKDETIPKRKSYEGLHVDDVYNTAVPRNSSKIGHTEGNKTDQIKEEFTRAVESLFDHEEELLNLHMNIIQENAELLTEEGRLLQSIQGDDIMDYDIDAYCFRLAAIIRRKQDLNDLLRDKLQSFTDALMREEELSASMKGK